MLIIVLFLLTIQSALGQQGSEEETGDPSDSGDILDIAATFGPQVKVAAYGIVFIGFCLLSTAVPDAPLLLYVCSMPILQFRGLRVALTVLQCAIVVLRTRSFRPLVPLWPLSVFLLCVVASCSWALDPAESLQLNYVGSLDTLLLVPFMIAARALINSQLTTTHRVLSALSFGCIPGCVLIIYNALCGIQWRGEAGYRMALLRPDLFSPLLAVSGIFLLFCVTSPTLTRPRKLAALILLPLICISLLLTGIRSGWVAFVFGGFFWLLHRRSFLAFGGALAVVAIVALVALGTAASLNLDEQLASRLSDESLHTGATRLELWEIAARGFANRPVLGIGWGCFPGLAADNTVGREIVTHNIFMRVLCELGFVGFGLFSAWIAAIALRLRRSSERALLGSLMIAVLAQGLFLDIFPFPYFSLILGMCDGAPPDEPSRGADRLERCNDSLVSPINSAAI